jgi:hypothetical protein
MPFPAGFPAAAAPSRGPCLRFFVQDTAGAAFTDTAYIFAQQVGANPLLPLPTVLAKYNPDPAEAPAAIAAAITTVSPTAIHAALAESAANAFPGAFTNPDVVRRLTVTFAAGWQGGDVTVVGTDAADAALSETFIAVAGTTVVGTAFFKTVTSASKTTIAGAGDTASIGTAAVHAAVVESAANAFPGPFLSLDVPRNLVVVFAAGWQGGNVTVVGTDAYDQPVSEVFATSPGNTVTGLKIFKTVTEASKAAVAGAADTAFIGTGTRSARFADVPQNPAGTVTETGYLWCSTIRLVNDEAPLGANLEYSFDGTNVHGLLKPEEEFVYRGRAEAGIAVRGSAAFRCEAW